MRSRLMRQAGLLLATSLVARLLGFAYRVLLARTVGAEAVGLFSMALPLFLVALTAASLGLPVGVAQSVAAAEARRQHRAAAAVRRLAVRIGGATGAAAAAAVLLSAPMLGRSALADPRATAALAVLAWAVPLAAVEAIYRGYWQGLQRMERVGLAQVGENAVRLAALVVWAALGAPLPPAAGAALAAAGVVLGEWVELVVVVWGGFPDGAGGRGRRTRWPARRAGRREDPGFAEPEGESPSGGTAPGTRDPALTPDPLALLRLSIPVALSRLTATLGMAADAVLVPLRLRAGGMTAAEAAVLFGRLTGMAMPVVMLPTVILFPVDQVLVPAVSAAAARGDRRALRRRAAAACAAGALVGFGTATGLYVGADAISAGLYREPALGPLLRTCAAIPPGLFAAMAAGTVLHGLGRTGTSFACQLLGSAVRLALVWLLAARPQLGVGGAALAFAAGSAADAAAAWLVTWSAVRSVPRRKG